MILLMVLFLFVVISKLNFVCVVWCVLLCVEFFFGVVVNVLVL